MCCSFIIFILTIKIWHLDTSVMDMFEKLTKNLTSSIRKLLNLLLHNFM